MRYLFTLVLLISGQAAKAQLLNNYHRALQVLLAARQASGPDTSILITAKGTVYNMGHYDTPEKTIEIPIEEKYGFFPANDVTYLYSEFKRGTKTFSRAAVSKQDSLYDYGYYADKLVKQLQPSFRFEVAKALPSKLLALAYEHRTSLRYLGTDSVYHMLACSFDASNNAVLFIHQQNHRLEKVEAINYSAIYGDITYCTTYGGYNQSQGTLIPSVRNDYEGGRLERTLQYTDLRPGLSPDSSNLRIKWVSRSFRKVLMDPVGEGEQLEFSPIASNLDLVKIKSQNNKVLVGKFDAYIALFEVPQGIDLNKQLLAELARRYPGKPLRYIFLTHHHPDHAGGIRAYAGLPVTIVTTPGNEAYFNKLMATTHTAGNTATLTAQVNVKFEFVPLNSSKTIKDKGNTVVAYEIGTSTTHTAEHLAYYFPASRILWTGDLLFFSADGAVYPAGQRGKSILDLINAKKLQVDKIYTSWPLHKQKDYGTVDFLKKLVSTQ